MTAVAALLLMPMLLLLDSGTSAFAAATALVEDVNSDRWKGARVAEVRTCGTDTSVQGPGNCGEGGKSGRRSG
jgi:hypothetical protein